MKKLIMASMLAAAAFAAGTGRTDESRLNLWPLVGYEDGALDVIWPLGHFKSSRDWRFFPVIKDNDLFCVFPELWFTRDGFAVLPLAAKYDFVEGTLFPVLWWDLDGSDKMHSVFPLYYYHGRGDATTFWAGCGLAGYKRDRDETSHWLLPLYARTGSGFYSIPYSRKSHSTNWVEAYLCGLAGRRTALDGTTYAHWCFPLWHKDQNSFTSLPYHREWDDKGETTSWLSVPALSGGWRDNPYWKERYLLGLGGATWGGKDGLRSSWAFPFYYENSAGAFVTPLGGWNRDSSWILPLFYTDKESFVSLPYMHGRDERLKSDTYVVPPLLSGCRKYDDGRTDLSALALYGHSRGAQGETRYDYLLPLYYYAGASGAFYSLLYGRESKGSYTNTWWATPLVGTRSGSKTGGWLFPLFNRRKDASFDKDLARLDSPAIPDDIAFSNRVNCWTNGEGRVCFRTNCIASAQIDSAVRGSVLLASDHDHWVCGGVFPCGEGEEYALHEGSKQGNRIFFNSESSRTVTYDIASRQKKSDCVESETMALCGLFYREYDADSAKGTSSSRTRILWKLWDREERNGDVTLDAFPGFTYDSKKNGYSKTSFLWRFFRYENNPEKGKKVDLLFIPVWR